MADCELLATCIFFNDKMEKVPATASLMKHEYCRNEYSRCARFMIFQKLGRPKVPRDLYPNDTERAAKIISSDTEQK